MENQDINRENDEMWQRYDNSRKRGKIFGGLLIVIIGALFLGRELGVEIPHWIFSWKTLLIGIGIVLAFKHGFSRLGWIFPILIGGIFLLTDLCPELTIKPLLWPILIILVGLFIIFKPRRNRFHYRHWEKWQKHQQQYGNGFSCVREGESVHEDTIDSTSIMGGVMKNVISKNFKGGQVTNIFGGAEINLSQADFEGTCSLELTNVFGGTKLIVPANWEISSSELTSVLGSIEDKRPIQPKTESNKKVLKLTGTTVFGGIDIKSF